MIASPLPSLSPDVPRKATRDLLESTDPARSDSSVQCGTDSRRPPVHLATVTLIKIAPVITWHVIGPNRSHSSAPRQGLIQSSVCIRHTVLEFLYRSNDELGIQDMHRQLKVQSKPTKQRSDLPSIPFGFFVDTIPQLALLQQGQTVWEMGFAHQFCI